MRFLFLLLMLDCAVYAWKPIPADEIVSKVDHNVITPYGVDSTVRDEVIAKLKTKLTPAQIENWGNVCVSLVLFGDEETIAKAMNARRARVLQVGRSESFGGDFRPVQPALIPYIVEDFFREDGEEYKIWKNDDQWVVSLPISIGSASDVLSLLRRSPAFSSKVKAWVGSGGSGFSFRTIDMRKFRDVMRQWWRENESHFAAKNYAAVKPGASLSEVVKPGIDSRSNSNIIPTAVGLSALAIATAAFASWPKKSE